MIDVAAIREAIETRRRLPSPATRRALREEGGLSLEQVAAACGVTRQAVAGWESGRTRPRHANLEKYVEVVELIRSTLGASP